MDSTMETQNDLQNDNVSTVVQDCFQQASDIDAGVQTEIEQVEDQTQTDVQLVEENTQPEKIQIKFDNINPLTLQYNSQFKCALSTSGQIINALHSLSDQISSGTKVATNDYQKSLYPSIEKVSTDVVTKFIETFVDNISDPVTLQVFGANLNGSRNDGRLNRPVTIRGVNKYLRYEYSQLGQLLNLLRHRLLFITSRDYLTIKRYVDSEEERNGFILLQSKAMDYCTYLNDNVYPSWEKYVNEARTQNAIKLNEDNVNSISNKAQHQKPFRKTNNFNKTEKDGKPFVKKYVKDSNNDNSKQGFGGQRHGNRFSYNRFNS